MEHNTLLKAQRPSRALNLFVFLLFLSAATTAFSYSDHIWLKSPKVVKTVFDVKVHALLRNLYDNNTLIDPEDQTWQKAYLEQERKGLLEQTIVYQYITENRVDVEIEKYRRTNASKQMKRAIKDAPDTDQTLEKWGIEKKDIDRWLHERLLLEKFLQIHPPFQAIITNRKIEQYYEKHKETKFLNRSLESIRNIVVEDYKKTYLQEEFKKWLDQEIRRQKWIVYG